MKGCGKREMKKQIFFLFCMVCLWTGISGKAQAASLEGFSFYEDGDVVGCIGDSITHVNYSPLSYVEMLDQYYLSRFPGREVEFRNLGAGGHRAWDVVNVYGQDPAFWGLDKAIIMLGTNEAILGNSTEDYIGNMERLIGLLKNDGLDGEDILILSPPLCDQNCAMNYRGGSPRWTFEDRVLAYMESLEVMAQEQGVLYLDLHTPMAELTEEMQKENSWNTLTTDCIHPNAAGQRLIAYYILQAQGAGNDPLSDIFVSGEGEVQAAGDAVMDFDRGIRGMLWTLNPETLPVAMTDDVLAFRELFPQADMLFRKGFRAEGLAEDVSYRVLAGDVEVGCFTGKELEEGIDFSMLAEYPQQEIAGQLYDLQKKRHQKAVAYRNRWIEVTMGRATYTPEEIQREHEKWRAADESLRNEINALAAELAGESFSVAVLEEGCSVEELKQEIEQIRKEAEEAARKAAEEQARKEAEEQARREAEEQAKKEAEEAARKAAEEQAAREAAEAQKAAQEQARKELLLKWSAAGIGTAAAIALILFIIRKAGKRKKEREEKSK